MTASTLWDISESPKVGSNQISELGIQRVVYVQKHQDLQNINFSISFLQFFLTTSNLTLMSF